MNKDIAQGKWSQIKGRLREQWGRLTDDDVDQFEGRYDRIVGKVQERYGRNREEAEREVDRFLDSLAASDPDLRPH